jgi:hypothetical protein
MKQKLRDETAETLAKNNLVWHRKCYAEATNKAHVERSVDTRQVTYFSHIFYGFYLIRFIM